MSRRDRSLDLRRTVEPFIVALAYGVAAVLSLALVRGAHGMAAMWPASGVLLAGLVRFGPRRAVLCLALATLASVGANLQAGNPVVTSLGYTLANMVEAFVGATLLRRWNLARPRFTQAPDVAWFCAATLSAALVSTAIAVVVDGSGGWVLPLSWFTTVTLGMLIVAPLLMITRDRFESGGEVGQPAVPLWVSVALLGGVALTTAGVFMQERYPALFLPLVALLAATYRLGPFGASAGIGLIAFIAPLLAALGHGPVDLGDPDAVEGCFFLQFYLLTLFASALPFGALLGHQRRLAADLAESERMHRLLADSSTDIILRLSLDGIARYASPAVEAVLGFSPAQTVGHRLVDFVHPEDRAAVDAAWNNALASATPEAATFRHAHADGSHAWLDVACRRVETGSGSEIVCRARDITKRRAAELAAEESQRDLREANRLLGMAERAAQVGHWRLDLVAGTLFWSPEVYRIHGVAEWTNPDLARALDFYHPDERERVAALVDRSIAEGEPFEFEARVVRADGRVCHVSSRGQPEIGYDGRTSAMFGVIQDISRQIETEHALEAARNAAEAAAAQAIRLADTDALTGVASRRRTLAALDEAIATSKGGGAPLSLAIFDIDHFKSINDRFGHPAGDAVLRRVARAAMHAVRPTDLVGRLGGEEFAVVLPGANAATALALAETLRRAIASSADGIDAGPPVTASIGIAALIPGGSAAGLLGEADRALYEAKGSGRNVARVAA